MDIVATSTLCLNVYSSLVFKELISMAMALFWVIACMRSSVIESADLNKFIRSGIIVYKLDAFGNTFLTLSDNVTFEGSLVRDFSTFRRDRGEDIVFWCITTILNIYGHYAKL